MSQGSLSETPPGLHGGAAPRPLRGVRRRRLGLSSGIEIALLDFGGRGPLALLHHATGFCAGVWGLVAEGLRERFHVWALDARGHGDSSKPEAPEAYRWECFADDLEELALALAAEHGGRIGLGVGHSFGGTATLAVAARRPALFERLLLVDPVIPPPSSAPIDPARREGAQRLARAARERRPHWPSRDDVRASWAGKDFFAGWQPLALELYLAEGLRELADGTVELKCPPEVEAAIFEASGSLDVFALAPSVTARVRIQWARRGNFPREVYEALAARMRQAEVEDVDAGHLVPMERPELVIASALRD